jgi:hypothetical protein
MTSNNPRQTGRPADIAPHKEDGGYFSQPQGNQCPLPDLNKFGQNEHGNDGTKPGVKRAC